MGAIKSYLQKIIPPDSIPGRIITMAWPVIAEMSSTTLTQIVDMMMVGRLGAVAVASVGISMMPLQYSIRLFNALNVGTTALVARFTGAKEQGQAGRTLHQSLFMAFGVMLLLGVSFFAFAPQIITFMGAEPEVVATGTVYLRILVPGFILMLLRMVVTAALRGIGDTKTPMMVNIMVNISNIIGNYLFIFGNFGFPEMGVYGAALATSLARGGGAIAMLYLLTKRHPYLWVGWKNFFHIDLEMIKRIAKVGLPASAEQLIQRIAQIYYLRIVASLGTVALAAHQIALKTESLSYMPGFGFAVATTALVGQNLGAKRPDRSHKSGNTAWLMAISTMGVMGILFFFFSESFMRLFTDDPEIIEMGRVALKIVAFSQIPMATHFIFAWGLRGAGDTKPVFYATVFATWVGRLGSAYLFVIILDMGLAGAWLAMVVDWTMRGAYVAWRFQQGKWKEIEV